MIISISGLKHVELAAVPLLWVVLFIKTTVTHCSWWLTVDDLQDPHLKLLLLK